MVGWYYLSLASVLPRRCYICLRVYRMPAPMAQEAKANSSECCRAQQYAVQQQYYKKTHFWLSQSLSYSVSVADRRLVDIIKAALRLREK